MAKNVLTPEFRVSYPSVFKPTHNKMSGKDEFSVQALFPKGADLSKLKAAVTEAMTKQFGANAAKWPKELRSPFRKQEDRAKEDEVTGKSILPSGYEEGAIFLNLKSKTRPGVVNQKVEAIIDETEFYGGCWARATVSCYAYGGGKTGFTPGVSFGLVNIQKTRDGEPFGNRTKAEDDFAPIEGATTDAAANDPTAIFGN